MDVSTGLTKNRKNLIYRYVAIYHVKRGNNIKTEIEKDLIDIAILIKNTKTARDSLRAEGERLQQQGLLLISQCAGTMVEILKHVEQQKETIDNLTNQIAWFWEKIEPLLYEGENRE